MKSLSNMTRPAGDPVVLRTGRSSRDGSDQVARALGWFSIGLGLAELCAPRAFTRTLGMEGREALVRGCGLREIGSGVVSLSMNKGVGLWGRVAGDALDLATLASAYHRDNPKRDNVGIAMVTVAGIAMLDVVGAQAVTASRRRTGSGDRRRYRNRSGFPQGIAKARGAARDATGHDKGGQSKPGQDQAGQPAGLSAPAISGSPAR